MHLIIGNKAYSSWSLRPWLVLKQFDIPFDETVVPLYEQGSTAQIKQYSPTGKVPVLTDGTVTVWDSLAICEYLAEQFPQKLLWPGLCAHRAEARSLAAEMHAGFSAMRQHLPFNTRRIAKPSQLPREALADIERFVQLTTNLRERFGAEGAFLMGDFSILDAMYAPIAVRCHTYAVPLPPLVQAWVTHIYALPAMQSWIAAASDESWVIPSSEPADK